MKPLSIFVISATLLALTSCYNTYTVLGINNSGNYIQMKVKAKTPEDISCSDTIYMQPFMGDYKYVNFPTNYWIAIIGIVGDAKDYSPEK